MKKGLKNFLALSAMGAIGYKIAKETGIVDRIKYKKEYEAAKKYIDGHHKGARFTNLEKTDVGFVCVVTKEDNTRIILTMTEAADGVYIFAEEKI